MSFITGVGSAAQFGKETAFNTEVTCDTLINMTSESISTSYSKGDEGNLLASKTATDKDLLGIDVSGSISFILRPEFAGLLLHGVMGSADTVAEASDGKYTHTFHLAGVNDDLPSFTLGINRKAIVERYTGVTFSALNIDATAGDYVKGSIDIVGSKFGSKTALPSASFTKPSFRCVGATLDYTDSTGEAMSLDVSTASIKIDNALEEAPTTYASGLYKGRPQHGRRSVTFSFEIPYSSEVETLCSSWITEDAGIKLTLNIEANSGETLNVTIPHVNLSEYSRSIGGTGIVTASCSGEALSRGNDEPIAVVLTDSVATGYGA